MDYKLKNTISFLLFICLIFEFHLVPSAFSLNLNNPIGRYGHQMVYDADRSQIVLFGGINNDEMAGDMTKTWIYSIIEGKWNSIDTNNLPSPRIGHCMEYNSITEKIILFGGMKTSDYSRVNDLWEFDPKTNEWNELFPLLSPSIRSDAEMFFDKETNCLILFGGYLSDDSHSSQTWIYNCTKNNWSEISLDYHPSGRYGHSFVFDETNYGGILFGGRVQALSSETWFFNLTSMEWNLLHPSSNPSSRYWFDMVDSTLNSSVILFGGDGENEPLRAFSDTWVFKINENIWEKLITTNKPDARNNHAMAFDSRNEKIFLFGGLGDGYSTTFSDFWSFDLQLKQWDKISEYSDNSKLFIGITVAAVTSCIALISIVIIKKRKRKNKK